ncbi:MAG: 3-dehydroquinate synthase [Acidobacteria bacterium]|nr:3-dehydroquinate synthase [Acidobacteriota bacterium]
MASFAVVTGQQSYPALVERGILARAGEFLPPGGGKVFIVSTADVWALHGAELDQGLGAVSRELLLLPGGEPRKRLQEIETLAAEMIRRGGDRSSTVMAFGGGIVNDMAGFLAAIFMRGIAVVQVPTTLLAQVDAAIGGKTGVNLECGKNLLGSFHPPRAVLIDPAVLATLPEREYRAGLYEIIKAGLIRSAPLFRLLAESSPDILGRAPALLDYVIAQSVRIKVEVVGEDEREGGLRRILNFGHTFGHALETETGYARFLHGEAVAWGMRAAAHLARSTGHLSAEDCVEILDALDRYGPVPPLAGISPERILARLVSDKKTVQGRVHFVLLERIGTACVVSGIDDLQVLAAIEAALA